MRRPVGISGLQAGEDVNLASPTSRPLTGRPVNPPHAAVGLNSRPTRKAVAFRRRSFTQLRSLAAPTLTTAASASTRSSGMEPSG